MHARLSNVSTGQPVSDQVFLEDETFWLGSKKVERRKNQKVGLLMLGWRELRERRPELFECLVLFQQPAAFMDEITQLWAIEDLARRVPQAVHQRDLFAAALTKLCLTAMKLSGQIPAWIAAKMTAVLQLTDTDIAFILKAFARKKKVEVAEAMKALARGAGEVPDFFCNKERIMEIALAAHIGVVQRNLETKLVLAGVRRNGGVVVVVVVEIGRASCRERV